MRRAATGSWYGSADARPTSFGYWRATRSNTTSVFVVMSAICLLVGAPALPTANAASAGGVVEIRDQRVRYVAANETVNIVAITTTSDGILVADSGTSITAGPGCKN